MIEKLIPAETRDTVDETPALDAAAIANLREAVGADTFQRLIGHCLRDGDAFLTEIEAARANGDERRLRAVAHSLAGLFPQFGAERAGNAARALETGAAGSVAEQTAELLTEGRAALAALAALTGTRQEEVAR